MANNDTGMIKTAQRELVKQYVTYDGSNRTQYIYEVRADADHGCPCMRTEYEYDGTTSRVVKRKESLATWDSSWDI